MGLQAARVLAHRGHRVLLTGRDAVGLANAVSDVRAAAPSSDIRSEMLDVSSFEAIRRFADGELARESRFDVVLHNAGVIFAAPQRHLTADGVEETLAVHAVGPLLLSKLLMPALARPSRLVFVGSGLHKPGSMGPKVDFRIEDPNLDTRYHPARAYKNSKLAQIWIAKEWERRFGPQGLHADVVCPGFVPVTAGDRSTGAQRFILRMIMPMMPFANTLEHGAQILVQWCERDLHEPGGRYFDGKAIVAPSVDAQEMSRALEFYSWAEQAISRA